MNTAWIYLLTAGVFELGFTTCLKLSQNFTRIPYILGFLLCGLISFYSLNKSLGTIPLGTAYAVWTGIGAFGTALIGIIYFNEPASLPRLLLLAGLIGCVAGLKMLPH